MIDLPSWLIIFPVLGFLVFVHELGHFVTAKWFGIQVTEFGFGFPPRIYGVKYRGTIYSINWIPLGGFVRMLGEEDPTDPQSFARQKAYKRTLVLVAGSFMNLLLPVVIITVLFMLPHDTLVGGDVIISAVAPGSPAKEAGLRAGDTILSVDGKPVNSTGDLIGLVTSKLGRPVELSVRRAGVISGLGASPELMSFEVVRVVPRRDPPKLVVVEEVTDPATQVSLSEARLYNRSLKVGDTMTQGAIGVMIGLVNPKFSRTSDPIWRAMPLSVETIWDVLVITGGALRQGVETRTNPGLLGPVGIAQAAGEGVERLGISWIFQFTALLSISLAIVNILPFPPLDGGRIMFVALEVVRRGKRISPHKEGLVHLVGFMVVIGLLLFMSYFEVQRLLNGESLFPR